MTESCTYDAKPPRLARVLTYIYKHRAKRLSVRIIKAIVVDRVTAEVVNYGKRWQNKRGGRVTVLRGRGWGYRRG